MTPRRVRFHVLSLPAVASGVVAGAVSILSPVPAAAAVEVRGVPIDPAQVTTFVINTDEAMELEARNPHGTRVVTEVPWVNVPPPREIPILVPPGGGSPADPTTGDDPIPDPPSLLRNFEAVPDAADDAGFLHIPPDTDGVIGPDHVMSVTNSRFRIITRDGLTVTTNIGIETFWGLSATTDAPFDPHVVYDPSVSRWFVVADANRRSASSRLLVAVSDDSNPNGTWTGFSVDADSGDTTWADYPGIGFNSKWLVVTNNMFTNAADAFSGPKMWVFDKADLVAGIADIDVFAAGFESAPFGSNASVIPAETFGSEPDVWLVDSGWASGETDIYRISRVTGATETPSWGLHPDTNIGVAGFFSSPTSFQQSSFSDAPQSGSATLIETNDSRINNVTFRGSSLWFVHMGGLPTASMTRTAAFATEFDPDGGGLSAGTVQQPVLDMGAGVFVTFPSVTVNDNGDAGLGFSLLSSSMFASAAFTSREVTDTLGTWATPVTYKSGEAIYTKDFGSGRVRWGDYSATSVDPVDGLTFWTMQEYADSPASTWGTWWAAFRADDALFVDLVSFTAESAGPGGPVTVRWTTAAELDNVGFHVYRGLPLENGRWMQGPALTESLVPAQGSPTEGASYEFVDMAPTGRSTGEVAYFLSDTDLNGVTTFHGPAMATAPGATAVNGWMEYED